MLPATDWEYEIARLKHWYEYTSADILEMTSWEIESEIAQIAILERRANYTTALALTMKLNGNGGKRPAKVPEGVTPEPPLQAHERFEPLELLGWTYSNLEVANSTENKLFKFDVIALHGIEIAAADGLLLPEAWHELNPIWSQLEFTLNHFQIAKKGGKHNA